MHKTSGKIIFLTIWLVQVYNILAQPALNVNVTITGGTWSLNVPAIDLTEAGNNYAGVYESAANQVLVSHSVSPQGQYRNHSWTVEIYKQDSNWNSLIELTTKRTGNGTGSTQQCTPSIAGGLVYQNITDIPTFFYSGTCARSNVPIQYKVDNISILLPAQNLSTTIYYRITVTAN